MFRLGLNQRISEQRSRLGETQRGRSEGAWARTMIFDSTYVGPQHFDDDDDARYGGSSYGEVRAAMFRNAYYLTWGAADEPPLPIYATTLGHLLRGLVRGLRRWQFLQAARRTKRSQADLRWGWQQRGFRRLLHPNGVCLFGTWEIDANVESPYSGYFRAGSKCLIIARYSTGLGVHRDDFRTLSLVGKLFPTTDPADPTLYRTANFITQEELGGARTRFVNEAVLRNAPDTTPWRRHLRDVPKLLLTGLAFKLADAEISIRQLYAVAELGKPAHEPTRAPQFMQLRVDEQQPYVLGEGLDFRDEVLAQIYDKGDIEPRRSLRFTIEVTDEGRTKGLLAKRREFGPWKKLGHITFTEAVASYNGDFVIHFHHPPWRRDRNNPER